MVRLALVLWAHGPPTIRGGVVTAAVRPMPLLDPIISTLEVMRDRLGDGPVHGLVPGLVVDDRAGWTPATRYTDEAALPNLITAAQRRWRASPHAAAALAWQSYTYSGALPAVL